MNLSLCSPILIAKLSPIPAELDGISFNFILHSRLPTHPPPRPLALVPPANPPHEHHRALIASIWHPLEEDNIDILSVPAVCDSIVKAGAVQAGGGGAGAGGVQVGQEPRTEAWEYRFVSGGGFTLILAYLYCPHHSYEQPLR